MAVFLIGGELLSAQSSWNKIRYEGGTIPAKVNPFDWNTTLRISQNNVELIFSGSKRLEIPATEITRLLSGERAYREIGKELSHRETAAPVPLFGILQASKEYLIGIEFTGGDRIHHVLLLSVRKDSYNDILRALATVSGQHVEGAF